MINLVMQQGIHLEYPNLRMGHERNVKQLRESITDFLQVKHRKLRLCMFTVAVSDTIEQI